MRLAAGPAIVLLLVALTTGAYGNTGGGEGEPGGGTDGEDTVGAYVLLTSSGETVALMPGSPGGTVTIRCYYYAPIIAGDGAMGPDIVGGGIWPPEEGAPYFLFCYDDEDDVVHSEIVFYDPGNPFGALASAEAALDLALAQLELPAPAVGLAPPAGAELVGLASWFWVDTPWAPLETSATLGLVTSTVTATPVGLTFDPGDGAAVIACEGPGAPWTPGTAGVPPCGHTYQHHGTYPVTASITWEVAWAATTGAGGPLDPLTTTSTVDLTATEVQAVIT